MHLPRIGSVWVGEGQQEILQVGQGMPDIESSEIALRHQLTRSCCQSGFQNVYDEGTHQLNVLIQ